MTRLRHAAGRDAPASVTSPDPSEPGVDIQPSARPADLPRTPDRRPALVVAVAAVVALALRTAFLATPAGGLDADEAVTGIMARRIAEDGEPFVFFLGQSYNSAVEQYPQALLFALGLPVTPLVLRIPQLAMSVVACVLVHRVGLRLLPSAWPSPCGGGGSSPW